MRGRRLFIFLGSKIFSLRGNQGPQKVQCKRLDVHIEHNSEAIIGREVERKKKREKNMREKERESSVFKVGRERERERER